MKSKISKILGMLALITMTFVFIDSKEKLSTKALKMNMTGNARLHFSKASYNLGFQKLNPSGEDFIDSELKKIHQIQEKLTSTSISNNGEIMITLAKSIDQNIVLVVFKNQQIQMIQKVLNMTDHKIDFQYGSIDFSKENPENEKIAYSQNVELEF
jgi:hypothetical protein